MNVKGFFSYGEHRSTSLLLILQATFAFQEILKICALILEKKTCNLLLKIKMLLSLGDE